MEQNTIHVAVQALWLQYKGLTIEQTRSWHRVDNAGYKPSREYQGEEIPAPGAFMVAN